MLYSYYISVLYQLYYLLYSTVNVQSLSVKCLSFSPLGLHNNKITQMPGGYWVETAKKKAGEYVRYRRDVYKGSPGRQKSRRVADTQVEGVEEIVEEVSPVPCQFLPD